MNWRECMTENTVTAWKVRINMSILASDLVRGAQYDQICQMKSLGPQTMNSINEPSCVLNIKSSWIFGTRVRECMNKAQLFRGHDD